MKKNKTTFFKLKNPSASCFAQPPFISELSKRLYKSPGKKAKQTLQSCGQHAENDISDQNRSVKEIGSTSNAYAELFDQLPYGNLILDSEGKIHEANYTAAELLGIKKSALKGMNINKLISDDQKSIVFENHIRALKSRSNLQHEIGLLRPDGSNFSAMLFCRKLSFASELNNFFLFSFYEVAGRIKTVEVLKNPEIFIENVFDSIQHGITVLDSELTVLKVNSTMRGWYPHHAPLEGKKCYEAFPGNGRPCDRCPSIKAIRKKTHQKNIVPWVLNRREKAWMELVAFPIIGSSGKVKGVIEYARNATDQINAEENLLKLEQKFHTMVNYTHSWEYWTDPFGNFVHMTPSCKRLTGYSPEDFYSNVSLYMDIIHPKDKLFFLEHLKEERSSETILSKDFRIIDRNGAQHWISHTCQPVFSKDGHYIGRRGSNRDITIHKKAEITLRKSSEQLEKKVINRTRELQLIADKMLEREKDLLLHKSKLEKVNKELLDTNKAVAVLARNIEKNRVETERDITHKISSKIIPLLEEIKISTSIEHAKSVLDSLSTHIKALTGESRVDADKLSKLTMTEIKISSLIKNGYTSTEIANKLHLSLHTVKTHRRNIRQKIKINNLNINLASYLKTIMP